ncbi:PREDICTED: kynurenine--oxoglutarate transaminase 3-like [Ceratosolen solmsi marchali]|uniref:Kynurenine--oxoglutarate transaminase 3-like n=1 Tax=Ceratosolen solmsi marchali TaxID=326594 RepID=A0AAJ7DX98_9HYME|nr:PREDICTED: kynurenine--oxoglutarate transaminase 3-like [Ceratosolen solmsi marchali]
MVNVQPIKIIEYYRIEYGQFETKYNLINLAHGSPDFLPPIFMRNALLNLTISNDTSINQYSNNYGHLLLRKSIAHLYSELINRNLNPENNVIVTTGATEALYVTLQAHTSPQDEWIIMEPSLDFYGNIVRMAGGTPTYIQLYQMNGSGGRVSSRDWMYDKKEMARLFNKHTKGIIINNPHNPTGKVFSKEELQFIADLAVKWNTIIIADEVYEWFIYESNNHIRMATIPNMFERTITICSASKTFSVNGWRIGWIYGPSELLNNLRIVHPNVVHSSPSLAQVAVAAAINECLEDFEREESYLENNSRWMHAKRNKLLELLWEIGMTPVIPEGGHFVIANWTGLDLKANLEEDVDEFLDYRFTKWLARNVGVLALPVSSFYSDENKYLGESFVRFCFVKKNKTLEKAAKLLMEWIQW